MRVQKYFLMILPASIAIWTAAIAAHATDDGLITKPSRYSVKETVTRFESAVKEREASGFSIDAPPMTAPFAKALDEMSDYATK